jgi:hypothetical protein
VSEPTLFERPVAPVRVEPWKAGEIRSDALLIRFGFGAAISVLAGVVSLAFGPRAGGILLAFPAILAASLTLIANEDDICAAREDAFGASVGSLALGCFAVVGASLFGVLPAGAVLAIAAMTWAIVAGGTYYVAWRPGGNDQSRPE